ncbi:hypothetical protein OKA05_05075 [Luteolibacter arcticus]|uniref:DUF2244 domain-containing protein n=1 Tax=Luteolibacter arcticus TaxID=1581411 RepID=A0ABT3GEP1_9BACT|nr:hypothetical protein [Luteolibacter arcticus]MCW1921913.1 hypothetical protein [Luteolibacter arcticus]
MKMRLIHQDSSPLRIWVVIFVIMSTITGLLFLIAGVGLAVLGIVPEFPSLALVLAAGLLGGACISTACAPIEISERQRRREAAFTIPGEHPRLGAYKYWPHHPHWLATVPLTPGAEPRVTLSGSGLAPSDDDVALWLDHIAQRMDELLTAAGMKLESEGPAEGTGAKIKLSPRRVEFCHRGEIEILFDAEPESDSGALPFARFSRNLELLDADWSM